MGVVTKGLLTGCILWLFVGSVAAADSDPALIEAAKNQDIEAVQALLQGNADVNRSQGDGATALAWASYWDDLETADLLLQAGADANLANDHGVAPLSLACTNASALMVEKLLNAGANPNAAQWYGETPLMSCARTGNVAAVRLLLDHAADVNRHEMERGQTALMWAVAEHHSEVVRALIERRADVNATTQGGFTALMFAAQQGDVESARILVQSAAELDATTPKQDNALTVASASGSEEVAIFLLEAGADPNVEDGHGITPLHYAVAQGIADITNIAPTAAFDEHYRVRPSNMLELASALLAHGANPNARVRDVLETFGTTVGLNGPGAPSMVDATPFFLAALSADLELMNMLLAAGADPYLPTLGNTTPLMAAVGGVFDANRSDADEEKALEAVRLLVELDVDVNEANAVGQTPMHAAAFTGATEMVQLLADKGGSVNVRAANGETPWSMSSGISPDANYSAFWAVHQDTADLLLRLGAIAMTVDEIEALNPGELQRAIIYTSRIQN
jgi:ankyrin repeat protein